MSEIKWRSIKDELPPKDIIIVGICQSRLEQDSDPVEDAIIALMRWEDYSGGRWHGLNDSGLIYYIPDPEWSYSYNYIIEYWVPWYEFPFPQEMLRQPREDKSGK